MLQLHQGRDNLNITPAGSTSLRTLSDVELMEDWMLASEMKEIKPIEEKKEEKSVEQSTTPKFQNKL